MNSYLVFSIAYYHIFEDFSRERSVDFKVEPISVWYPTLWRHKYQYNFYVVRNNFISDFKKLIFGPTTSRLSLEVASFLAEKQIFETTEDFSLLRLFGFQLFVTEVCKQYKYWAHFFNEKRKNKFIPSP
jgi:hypothetical protein